MVPLAEDELLRDHLSLCKRVERGKCIGQSHNSCYTNHTRTTGTRDLLPSSDSLLEHAGFPAAPMSCFVRSGSSSSRYRSESVALDSGAGGVARGTGMGNRNAQRHPHPSPGPRVGVTKPQYESGW